MRCWRSTGAGFAEQFAGPPWSDAAGWQAIEYAGTIRLGDVDGDGRADLCGRAAAGFRCFLWRDPTFEGPVLLSAMADADGWTDPSRWSTIRLADIDGDGAADVCARDADGFVCWPWDGVGFGRRIMGPPLSDGAGWNARARYRSLRTGDANGDGRVDVCARDADGLRCWLAGGGSFTQLVFGPAWTDADGWDEPGRQGSLIFAGGGPALGTAGDPAAGCACSVPRPATGLPGAVLLVLGVAWVLVRRRRD
jgi:MYXO-CTERM domain-containing protein